MNIHPYMYNNTRTWAHVCTCLPYLELWEEPEEILEDLLDGRVAARVGHPERDGAVEALEGE